MKEIIGQSIGQVRQLLSKKEISASEIVDLHYARIAQIEPEIAAFNAQTRELAFSQAKNIDRLIAENKTLPPLAGVTVAIKDNICVPGYPTTCSSRMLESFCPPYQATVAERLTRAGALFIGKTNMDEFAMGSSTENSAFHLTRNPWNTKMVPGGSSGGSAAAVSAGETMIALGSDTGGSIRLPASFCGVVGMKPTYGLVSRFGLVAFASSLDQIGPIGRTVEDVAITLGIIAGHDTKDSTSLSDPLADFANAWKREIKGIRIGIIEELQGEAIQADVREAVLQAASTLESLGARVDRVSLPGTQHALPVYYLIATAEASANLARYDGVKYGFRDREASDILSMYFRTRMSGFGAEVKRRIMLGTYALSSGYYDAYYKKAQQVRRLIKQDFDRAFERFDLLISPTSPCLPFAFGEKTTDPLTMYLTDIAAIPANLAGLPAISIPCGFGQTGLPIGLQLLGGPKADILLLSVSHAFEQATDFHTRTSPYISKMTSGR